MSLSDMIEQDAKAVFCNPNDFAEPVTYYKENGKARHINAVVIRDALAILPEDGDTIAPVFEVHVANDGVEGILSEELNNLSSEQVKKLEKLALLKSYQKDSKKQWMKT